MNLQNRYNSLRFWLFGPSALIVLLFSCIVIWLTWEHAAEYRDLRTNFSEQEMMESHVNNLLQSRFLLQQSIFLYALSGDSAHLSDLEQMYASRMVELSALLNLSTRSSNLHAEVEAMGAGFRQAKTLQREVVTALQTKDLVRANQIYSNLATILKMNGARLKDIQAQIKNDKHRGAARLEQLILQSFWLLLGGLGLSSMIVLIVTLNYRSRIFNPLRSLHQGIRSLVTGHLGLPLAIPAAPREITEIAIDFNAVTHTLAQTQQELTKARDEAEAEAQSQAEFLANMSHEIRTPLNAIVGMAELLQETPLTEDQVRCFSTLCQSSDVLLSIVNDILDYSRLESRQVSLECIPFELKALAHKVLGVVSVIADKKHLTLRSYFEPDTEVYVQGDPRRIEQVLMNLLGNAIKFTDTGEVVLKITARLGGERIAIQIEVKDSGIGIAAAHIPHLFKRFAQSDSTITRRYGGTGLGLAIVKQTVDLMGGSVRVASELKKGSKFCVALLLPHSSASAVAMAQSPPPVTATQRTGGRVLVVDDAPDNRMLIAAYLKDSSWEITMAENGAEAIEKFKAAAFDVILMDMQMPVVDGYQATQRIREIERESARQRTCIIALTAHAFAQDAIKTAACGCDHHLTKPIRKQALLQAIETHHDAPMPAMPPPSMACGIETPLGGP